MADFERKNAATEYAFNWYNWVKPHSYNEYLTPDKKMFSTKKVGSTVTKTLDHRK